VRSASRAGYSDFGVNRQRVETLRARFSRTSNASGTTAPVPPVRSELRCQIFLYFRISVGTGVAVRDVLANFFVIFLSLNNFIWEFLLFTVARLVFGRPGSPVFGRRERPDAAKAVKKFYKSKLFGLSDLNSVFCLLLEMDVI
jgi:hypothetical protein